MVLSPSEREYLLDQICVVTVRLTTPHGTEVDQRLKDELRRLVTLLWGDSRASDQRLRLGDYATILWKPGNRAR